MYKNKKYKKRETKEEKPKMKKCLVFFLERDRYKPNGMRVAGKIRNFGPRKEREVSKIAEKLVINKFGFLCINNKYI